MAHIKKLLDGLTQEDLEKELYNRYDDEYEDWKQSEEYVTHVNEQLEDLKPIYSNVDIYDSLNYASKSIMIEPSEVGKKVYDKLFSEKVIEFLNDKF